MVMKHAARIKWIDYAKALGIVLVVLGHTGEKVPLITWLYTFHMPLFFFLSGLTFSTTRKDFISHKITTLLLPYLGYSVVTLGYDLLQKFIFGNEVDLLSKMIGIFVQLRGTEYSIGLWFLPLLFLTEVLMGLLDKLPSQKLKAGLVCGGFIASVGYAMGGVRLCRGLSM